MVYDKYDEKQKWHKKKPFDQSDEVLILMSCMCVCVCMFTKLDAQVGHMDCARLEVQCILVNYPFMVDMNKVILKLQPLLQKKIADDIKQGSLRVTDPEAAEKVTLQPVGMSMKCIVPEDAVASHLCIQVGQVMTRQSDTIGTVRFVSPHHRPLVSQLLARFQTMTIMDRVPDVTHPMDAPNPASGAASSTGR